MGLNRMAKAKSQKSSKARAKTMPAKAKARASATRVKAVASPKARSKALASAKDPIKTRRNPGTSHSGSPSDEPQKDRTRVSPDIKSTFDPYTDGDTGRHVSRDINSSVVASANRDTSPEHQEDEAPVSQDGSSQEELVVRDIDLMADPAAHGDSVPASSQETEERSPSSQEAPSSPAAALMDWQIATTRLMVQFSPWAMIARQQAFMIGTFTGGLDRPAAQPEPGAVPAPRTGDD